VAASQLRAGQPWRNACRAVCVQSWIVDALFFRSRWHNDIIWTAASRRLVAAWTAVLMTWVRQPQKHHEGRQNPSPSSGSGRRRTRSTGQCGWGPVCRTVLADVASSSGCWGCSCLSERTTGSWYSVIDWGGLSSVSSVDSDEESDVCGPILFCHWNWAWSGLIAVMRKPAPPNTPIPLVGLLPSTFISLRRLRTVLPQLGFFTRSGFFLVSSGFLGIFVSNLGYFIYYLPEFYPGRKL